MYPTTCWSISSDRCSLADRVCRVLLERGVDFAPLVSLAKSVDAEARAVLAATTHVPYLGFLTIGSEPNVYCVPPQPGLAGFRVAHRSGRLRLRLPARGLRPALWISGQRVGPAPRAERASPAGSGELAYTVACLTRIAENWLPDVPDPAMYLFELIVEGWRHASASSEGGGLGIHRARFTESIAFGAGAPGGATDRIELVTNRYLTGHELANVYPIPATHTPSAAR